MKVNNKRIVNLLLCLALSSNVVSAAGVQNDTNAKTFTSDYGNIDEVIAAGDLLAEEISNDSIILLKNEDHSLPLAANTRVSVFGKESSGYYAAIAGAGFEVNHVLSDFEQSILIPAAPRGSTILSPSTQVDPADYKANVDVMGSFDTYNGAAIVVLARSGGEGNDNARAAFQEGYPTREVIENDMLGIEEWNPVGSRGHSNAFDHYLELDDFEIGILDMLQEDDRFDNIIIVIASDRAMELPQLNMEKYSKIRGCIWNYGVAKTTAVGSVLNGSVNPSGRTVDMLYADFKEDPTWENFANNLVGQIADRTGALGNQYTLDSGLVYTDYWDNPYYEVSYEEGIYLGYHYYETRGFTDGEDWYNNAVVRPFGYGLSYTTFDWEIASVSPEESAVLAEDDTYTVEVKVTNTGDVAGKDVVELFYEAPYYTGQIEKAKVEFADFAKTKLLQPGESEIVTLTIDIREMASYDYNDANRNGFTGWELDGGEYKFYISRNAHSWSDDAALSQSYSIPENGYLFGTDDASGKDVQNRFDYISEEMEGRTLSRADWEGTWPSRPLWFDVENDTTLDPFWAAEYRATHNGQNWTADDTDVTPKYLKKGTAELVKEEEWLDNFQMPLIDTDKATSTYITDPAYDEANPRYPDENGNPGKAPWYREIAPSVRAWEDRYTADNPAPIQLKDLIGKDYDDPMWDTYMEQFTVAQMVNHIITTFNWNQDLALGIPDISQGDGPGRVGETSYAYLQLRRMSNGDTMALGNQISLSATWNKDLAYRDGELNGEFGLWSKILGWYAPGANTHRTPFSGRNGQYYSEDGRFAGLMNAAVCKGAQDKGMVTFIKHYALNDQETDRDYTAVATWANEQTIRQIYLRPFELAVKKGNCLGMMTSFNRVGFDWAGASYELLTEIPRDEWGWKGIYITDAAGTSQAANYMNTAQEIRAGNDLSLDGWAAAYKMPEDGIDVARKVQELTTTEEALTPTMLWALRDCTKRSLYVMANTACILNGHSVSLYDYDIGVFKTSSANISSGAPLLAKADEAVEFVVADPDLTDVKYILFKVKSDGKTLGKLPDGLIFDAEKGVIEGTLGQEYLGKSYLIGICVADGDILPGEEWTSLTTNFFSLSIISETAELESGTVGTAATYDVSKDGGVRYAVSNLPSGLALNAETGMISGDFTSLDRRGNVVEMSAGEYGFTVTAFDAEDAIISVTYYSITVNK